LIEMQPIKGQARFLIDQSIHSYMALRLPHSAFIHVPKTGGTWCRSTIQALGLARGEIGQQHSAAFAVRDKLKGLFTFGTVRNPVTWLQSRYAYDKRSGRLRPDLSYDFNTWVEYTLDKKPTLLQYTMFYRLGYTLSGESTEYSVDFICKNESLLDDFMEAMRLAGEKIDEAIVRNMPPKKVCSRSDKWQAQCQYRKETLRLVIDNGQAVFKMFDYPADVHYYMFP